MNPEHPFAQFIRILGKGKNGSRPLTQLEACEAFTMVMQHEVTAEQLGAFLMLMRVKEETAEEVAGFVEAVKKDLATEQQGISVDLDWSSYAGKRRQLPWYLLTTFLFAENGTRLFMHGASGHTAGRIYTKDVLQILGIGVSQSFMDVKQRLDKSNFAYMDIERLSPRLHEIIELRPFLGLRSPVHTVSRMLNPFDAEFVIQGIFHPGYRPVHQEAGKLLNQHHLAVVKGDGGEIERNPDMACLVQSVLNGTLSDEEWPAMFARRHVKDDQMDVRKLENVWAGKEDDEYGISSVIGTAAIGLKLMGKAQTQQTAQELATSMWEKRSRSLDHFKQ